jgi:hypothetical protein
MHPRIAPTRAIGLFLAAGAMVLAALSASAQSPQALQRWAGTWRLNVTKSKASPGPQVRSNTTVITVTGKGLMAVSEVVDAQGQQNRVEQPAEFDGREHALKGTAQPTARTYKWIDDYAFEWVTKVKGQTTTTTRVQLSRDAKTMTLTTTGKNLEGQSVNNVTIFERQ